jgi:hypothetical protein
LYIKSGEITDHCQNEGDIRIQDIDSQGDSQGIENGTNVIWYEKDSEINIHFRKAVKSIKEMRGSILGGKDLSKIRTADLLDDVFWLS